MSLRGRSLTGPVIFNPGCFMTQQYEFKAKWLPYLLVLPQMVIVFVFFFWPSLQGVWQSFFLQDPFGGRVIFVQSILYKNAYTYDLLTFGPTGNYFANGILIGSTLFQFGLK